MRHLSHNFKDRFVLRGVVPGRPTHESHIGSLFAVAKRYKPTPKSDPCGAGSRGLVDTARTLCGQGCPQVTGFTSHGQSSSTWISQQPGKQGP